MKISIVIPVYNMEKYLSQCIQSIVSQTYKDLEIIFVDDGSIDCSRKICDEYALKDSRIKVVHKKNGGLVSARQAGIQIASGEYIGFVDADDWIEPDMYQTLCDAAKCENADIVAEGIIDDFGGNCITVLNQVEAGVYQTQDEREKLYENMICCMEFFGIGIQPYLCNKIFRREIVVKHMTKIPLSVQVGEDAAAVYPMLAMAKSIVILDTVHYHYCHHTNSMMMGNRNENREYDNAVLLHSWLIKSFKELGIDLLVNRQLDKYTINNLMVRAYRKIVQIDGNHILFPFNEVNEGDSIVIYGAGALGRAVYQYAMSCEKLQVRVLVDRNAGYYQRIGMKVCTLEETVIQKSDKVVVAVFSQGAYQSIHKSLVSEGVKPDQIVWIDSEAARIANWIEFVR